MYRNATVKIGMFIFRKWLLSVFSNPDLRSCYCRYWSWKYQQPHVSSLLILLRSLRSLEGRGQCSQLPEPGLLSPHPWSALLHHLEIKLMKRASSRRHLLESTRLRFGLESDPISARSSELQAILSRCLRMLTRLRNARNGPPCRENWQQ